MSKQILVILLAAIALTSCKESSGVLVIREPDFSVESRFSYDYNLYLEIDISTVRLKGQDFYTTTCAIKDMDVNYFDYDTFEEFIAAETLASAEVIDDRNCSVEYGGGVFAMDLDAGTWVYTQGSDPSQGVFNFSNLHNGDPMAGDVITFDHHLPMTHQCFNANGYPENCD